MLGYYYTLVDGRTECNLAGWVAWEPIMQSILGLAARRRTAGEWYRVSPHR